MQSIKLVSLVVQPSKTLFKECLSQLLAVLAHLPHYDLNWLRTVELHHVSSL